MTDKTIKTCSGGYYCKISLSQWIWWLHEFSYLCKLICWQVTMTVNELSSHNFSVYKIFWARFCFSSKITLFLNHSLFWFSWSLIRHFPICPFGVFTIAWSVERFFRLTVPQGLFLSNTFWICFRFQGLFWKISGSHGGRMCERGWF